MQCAASKAAHQKILCNQSGLSLQIGRSFDNIFVWEKQGQMGLNSNRTNYRVRKSRNAVPFTMITIFLVNRWTTYIYCKAPWRVNTKDGVKKVWRGGRIFVCEAVWGAQLWGLGVLQTVGGGVILRNILLFDNFHVVANCCRTIIPKLHSLMLLITLSHGLR